MDVPFVTSVKTRAAHAPEVGPETGDQDNLMMLVDSIEDHTVLPDPILPIAGTLSPAHEWALTDHASNPDEINSTISLPVSRIPSRHSMVSHARHSYRHASKVSSTSGSATSSRVRMFELECELKKIEIENKLKEKEMKLKEIEIENKLKEKEIKLKEIEIENKLKEKEIKLKEKEIENANLKEN